MKKIKLKCGFCTVVDDFDYELLSKMHWHTAKRGFYVCGFDPVTKKNVKMHRLIMQVENRHDVVDHKDGNFLNNTRENLRVCNQAQNAMNANARRGSSSQHKGVSWCKRSRKWKSAIMFEGKSVTIGKYTSEKAAAAEYNKYAKIYHGEYARLNKI